MPSPPEVPSGYSDVKRVWTNPREQPLHIGHCGHRNKCRLYAQLIDDHLRLSCTKGHTGDAIAWRSITLKPELSSIGDHRGRTRKKDLEAVMRMIFEELNQDHGGTRERVEGGDREEMVTEEEEAIIIRRHGSFTIKGLIGCALIVLAAWWPARQIFLWAMNPFTSELRHDHMPILADELPSEVEAAQNAVNAMCTGRTMTRDEQGRLHC